MTERSEATRPWSPAVSRRAWGCSAVTQLPAQGLPTLPSLLPHRGLSWVCQR